jgi:DNA-3-methyladenine glycosylase II
MDQSTSAVSSRIHWRASCNTVYVVALATSVMDAPPGESATLPRTAGPRHPEVETKVKLWRPRKAVSELSARDPRFERLVSAVGHPAIPVRPSTFEWIARAIAYQQLAGAAASAIWGRTQALFGEGGMQPEAVLQTPDAAFRDVGLSGAKTRGIKDLARHVAEGLLDPAALTRMDDEAVIDALTSVWGIGRWSAQMHLMFSLKRIDVWPVLDLGVRKGWAKFTGDAEPGARDLEPLGDPYRPYRSILAWYMWRIHDVEFRP